MIIFTGPDQDVMKVKHLIQLAPATSIIQPKNESKRSKETLDTANYVKPQVSVDTWLS